MMTELILGDCLEIMPTLDECSVDTIITDPPYGLEFMGKDWDKGVPGERFWREALRVAKPGACLMAMGGTRTFHRLVCAIEDAGWEVRDTIAWLYGSGFPKSYDIGKGIDKVNGESGRMSKFVEWMRTTGIKASEINRIIEKSDIGSHYLRLDQPAIPTLELWEKLRPYCGNIPNWVDELVERIEAEREVVGSKSTNKTVYQRIGDNNISGDVVITAPATPAAQLWHGWGTALKPAMELICVAQKPREGTYVENALKYGVAGLWIDGGRVEASDSAYEANSNRDNVKSHWGNSDGAASVRANPQGRFPANVIHDGSDEVTGLFPQAKAGIARNTLRKDAYNNSSYSITGQTPDIGYGDSGSAARFFYCAKASRSERNAGLEGMPEKQRDLGRNVNQPSMNGGDGNPYNRGVKEVTNHHPTVKPLALMRYLVRLTKTPTGGVVLDPFMGSGTTGIACVLEGREFIGIELDPEYLEIAQRRIEYWQKQMQPRLL